ncbi:ABATE domain-containing protein, partial [Streptomyces flavofungini]|uniref:ABATE domain-containing protein n=1 Tax=Streptomyces flavofungini TaxID=68200 RepID=UPI0034DF4B4C
MALGMAPAPYELRFDSGRSCLDLVATNHPVERLGSVAALRAWLLGAGLVPPDARLAAAGPPWLDHFHALRRYTAELVDGEIDRLSAPRSQARRAATEPSRSTGWFVATRSR